MKTFAILFSVVLMGSTALSAVIRVPGDSPTIQAAILSANDGDTLRVFSGTYLGPITVTKSLVLIGSRDTATTTIIAPQDFGTNSAYNHLLKHFTAERAIVYIGASPRVTVQMAGFTVDGLRLGPSLSDTVAYSGILAERCNVTLKNNTVRNVLPADSAGSTWDPQNLYNGRGIEVRGDSANATISNNRLEQINRYHILINGTDDNLHPSVLSPRATVSGNTILGKGVYNGGQKGIWFDAGAWGIASGNTIMNFDFPFPVIEPDRSSGIVVRYGALDKTHNVTIADNRVIAASAVNSKGIYVQGSNAVVTGNYVSGFRWNIESHDGVSILIARDSIISGHIGIHVTSEKNFPSPDSVTIGGSPQNMNVIHGQDASSAGGFAISLSFRDPMDPGHHRSSVPVDARYNDFGVYSAEEIGERIFDRCDTTISPHNIDTVLFSPFYFPPDEVGRDQNMAEEFRLEQNYPNPFNPSTAISYKLSAVSFVTLKVYDILGREVAVLVNERKGPGRYEVRFDASGLGSGVYVYRLVAGDLVRSRKLILLK